MNTALSHQTHKKIYEVPQISIIQPAYADIITTSVNGDANQGEWDPQLIDEESPIG